MEILFRLLGFCAGVGAVLSRYRVAGIPASILPLFPLVFAGLCLPAADVAGERSIPRGVTLAETAQALYSGPRFVLIQGVYDQDVVVEPGETGGSETSGDTYMAFVDTRSRGAIMVVVKDLTAASSKYGSVMLAGMLDTPPKALAAKLPPSAAGKPLSHTLYLRTGDAPINLRPLFYWLFALLGIPGLLYLIAFFQEYVVFRKQKAAWVGAGSIGGRRTLAGLGVRVTGVLSSDDGVTHRFLEATAVLQLLPVGGFRISVSANGPRDQPFTYLPISKRKKAGSWGASVLPGAPGPPTTGRVYLGTSARPAVRFLCPQSITLSLGSEEDRERLVTELNELCSAPKARRA